MLGSTLSEGFASGNPIVVDASVVVEYLVDLGQVAAATRVFRAGLDTDGGLWAPDLMYAEVSSAVNRLVRKRAISASEGQRVSGYLPELPLRITTVGPLMDACYVALARRIAADFVTADKRLARTVGGGGRRVLALDEVV